MSAATRAIPTWVSVLAIVHLGLALLFATLAYANPAFQFPELADVERSGFAIGLFANRNIAVSVALVLALILRDHRMLLGVFVIRLASDVLDFGLAASLGMSGIAELLGTLGFFSLALWLPESLAIWRLSRSAPAPPADTVTACSEAPCPLATWLTSTSTYWSTSNTCSRKKTSAKLLNVRISVRPR